jgi:hypothetical protein
VVGTRRMELTCSLGDVVRAAPGDQRVDESVALGRDIAVGKALPVQ